MHSKMVNSWFHLYLLCSLCIGIFSAPLDPSYEEQDPELTGGYFEGDIILDGDRTALLKAERLWPKGKVPYTISDQFAPEFADYIVQAMRRIEACSCIRFVPRVKQTAYLSVLVSPNACNAQLGYMNSVRTLNLFPVELDKGCFRPATIEHELLHSLGFIHEQSAPNRDKFVKILAENIQAGKEHNFEKRSASNFGSYGVNYDYGSVMHYQPLAFSTNGQPTIEALKPEGVGKMGQRIKMSDADITRLNNLYKCT